MYRIKKFSFPERLWGQKKLFNACSGLPNHRHNYLKMFKFANKIFFKINSPYSAPTPSDKPLISSVAEPHHYYAASVPGKNFDAAPAAPASTLLYSKTKFLKRTKVGDVVA
jgi:hypothetical protein